MNKSAKRVLLLTIGCIFTLLGLFGLILPFLQGIIFLAIGCILFSLYSPQIRLALEKHTAKYPDLNLIMKKIEKWITKIIGEV